MPMFTTSVIFFPVYPDQANRQHYYILKKTSRGKFSYTVMRSYKTPLLLHHMIIENCMPKRYFLVRLQERLNLDFQYSHIVSHDPTNHQNIPFHSPLRTACDQRSLNQLCQDYYAQLFSISDDKVHPSYPCKQYLSKLFHLGQHPIHVRHDLHEHKES